MWFAKPDLFCVSLGHGVTQSNVEACRWYRLAADQGEAGAQRQLGDMYEFGWGIEKNIPMARHWYELAAGQGDPLAQNALRLMGSE